jgi:hypothetical protein
MQRLKIAFATLLLTLAAGAFFTEQAGAANNTNHKKAPVACTATATGVTGSGVG